MPGTVVTAIMTDIRYAATIITKVTRVIGRTAKSAGNPLQPKYTFGTGPTNIILRSLRIRPNMNPPVAQHAAELSSWEQTATRSWAANIHARNVTPRKREKVDND